MLGFTGCAFKKHEYFSTVYKPLVIHQNDFIIHYIFFTFDSCNGNSVGDLQVSAGRQMWRQWWWLG